MCTLEVLLIADVMRRTTRDFDANNNDNGVRRGARSVCRKLFACEDPTADRSRLLRRMEEEIRRQDSDRWNFDFTTETPLPGRYQWVRVSQEVSAPASSQTVVEECVPSDSATTSKTSQVGQRKTTCRAEQLKITGCAAILTKDPCDIVLPSGNSFWDFSMLCCQMLSSCPRH
ncbi:uncharacterized protein LOC118198799 [Stegodyphus dumicola]|uniref:uncharacterized protein LOC118198799 n=1 Tax=Stegodyphus dumicola TaxID=202533 RepID=UPI0015A8ECAF|nr:uncharacterized protein LOC118198799 [Stegodyphus dumicola]